MKSSLLTISFKTTRLYCLLQMSVEPLVLLVAYLNYNYGEDKNNPAAFSSVTILLDAIIILFTMLLLFISGKCRKPAVQYFIIMAINILYFEILLALEMLYQAYFMFLFLYSFTKNLSLYIGFNIWTIFGIHSIIYAYHITRPFVTEEMITEFPLFTACTLIISFLILDAPFFYVLQSNMCFIKQQEDQINSVKLLIDIIPSPFFIYSNGKILFTNQMVSLIFSCQELETIIAESKILSRSVIFNFQYKAKFYSLKAIKFNMSAYDSNAYVVSITDNTDIVNAEKSIAAENAKWLFINSTCHQVRTPVSCIESSINLLDKSIDEKDSKSIEKYMSLTQISCSSLRHIIDDSIFLCEDSNNGIVLHSESFKFQEIITEIQNRFQFETKTKSINFTVQENKYPFYITTDKKMLLHSICTLLTNSFKYTFVGSISFNYTITKLENGHQLNIEVSDTGIGIKNNDKTQIFCIFSQTEAKKAQNNTANGVGLYIVKRIITMLNGSITFASELEKGTVFSFWIPVEVSYEEQSHKIKTQPLLDKISSELKVLVVDDNTSNVFILSNMLTKLSIKCDKAHNGLEAVKMYEQNDYELILMDINMPIMNGYEASKKIKEWANSRKRKVVIVAVSAQNQPLEESMSSNGIDDWVEKPIRFDRLTKIVYTKYE